MLELILHFGPFIGIFGNVTDFGDNRPNRRKLHIQLQKFFLARRQLVFGVYRFNRTLGFTQGAVDALVGID